MPLLHGLHVPLPRQKSLRWMILKKKQSYYYLKKKSVYDWLAHLYLDPLGRHHSPYPPFVVGFVTPFYRVFSFFFSFLAFPGCLSFCGSHLRFWLCLRFAHPVITAPFSRPIATIIRRSLRPTLHLVLIYRQVRGVGT